MNIVTDRNFLFLHAMVFCTCSCCSDPLAFGSVSLLLSLFLSGSISIRPVENQFKSLNTHLSNTHFVSMCVCCTYGSTDNPTKMEKTGMAESIISAFPVLQNSGTHGYVSYS